jgi:hypothetical protein
MASRLPALAVGARAVQGRATNSARSD